MLLRVTAYRRLTAAFGKRFCSQCSGRVYVFAEYPVSIPFNELDVETINEEMRQFKGLISKTWLSGDNHTVGGFYEFENRENAENYIQNYLIPFGDKIGINGTFKIFNKDVTMDASVGMNSPYCTTKLNPTNSD